MPSRVTKRPPPSKIRPIKAPKTLELTFDTAARQDYLTGFSKRKKARAQAARETAEAKDKEERKVQRRELREKRKTDLSSHLTAIGKEMRRQNRILDGDEDAGLSSEDEGDSNLSDSEIMWDGITPNPAASLVAAIREEDAEAEYIDEDRYTTVTVEPMKLSSDEEEDEEVDYAALDAAKASELHAKRNIKGKPWLKRDAEGNVVKANKVKKKKFRYESKAERAVTARKQRSKNAKAAKSRRDAD